MGLSEDGYATALGYPHADTLISGRRHRLGTGAHTRVIVANGAFGPSFADNQSIEHAVIHPPSQQAHGGKLLNSKLLTHVSRLVGTGVANR